MDEQRERGVSPSEQTDQLLQWLLERVDLVPRGEFDAQVELLKKALQRADDLDERVRALENKQS